MKFYKTLLCSVMVFSVLTIVSCANITKEEGMTTLYNKIKGGGVVSFDNLTPEIIEEKLVGVTNIAISFNDLKVGSIFIFEGSFSRSKYWGKVLVTKVDGNKLFCRYTLYKTDKSLAMARDNQILQQMVSQILGTVTPSNHAGPPVLAKAMIEANNDITVSSNAIGSVRAKILLLN